MPQPLVVAIWNLRPGRDPSCRSGGDPKSPDFRDLLLALNGVDLRHCSRCGAFALVRVPLELPASSGTSPQPSPTSTYPPPDTS